MRYFADHWTACRPDHLITKVVARRRLIVTADRGFADQELIETLQQLCFRYVIRVKGETKILWGGQWQKFKLFKFVGHSKQRTLGWVE